VTPADEALGSTAEAEGVVAAVEAVAEAVGEVEAADALEEAAAEVTAGPGAMVAEVQALVAAQDEIPVQIAEAVPRPPSCGAGQKQGPPRTCPAAWASAVERRRRCNVAAAVGDGSREDLDNSRQLIHRRLERREVRPESFSLGALSLPAFSPRKVVGVEGAISRASVRRDRLLG